jgi:hypothetical protein
MKSGFSIPAIKPIGKTFYLEVGVAKSDTAGYTTNSMNEIF